MNVLYFYLFLLVHPYIGMWWKSFEQADRKSWEALVPGYNYFVAFKIACNKPWWSLLMIFPGVHLVMWSVLNTSYIRRFGYFSLIDTIQGIFFPYLILFKIQQSGDKLLPETNWANSKEISTREWGDHLALFLALPVIGHVLALGMAAVTRAKPGKKTKVKEWGDSLIFAIVAASVIRTYVFEPFQIPTGSMEKTLLVGDFLFVNKLAYGPKVPVTPLSYPLVHNTVPWVNIKSYTTFETLEYTRIPGYANIERFDVVVFNYPSGDTAVYDPRVPDGLMGHDYHGVLINEAIYLFEESENLLPGGKMAMNAKNYVLKTYPNVKSQDSLNMLAGEVFMQYKEKIYAEKDFLGNLEKWKSKARKVIGEDKITHVQNRDGSYGIIEHYGLIYRPVDKRENYIKRCVGLPGDVIEIIESELYVNGKKQAHRPFQNLQYTGNFKPHSVEQMDEKYDLEFYRGDYREIGNNLTLVNVTDKQKAQLEKDFNIKLELVRETQYSDNDTIEPSVLDLVQNLQTFPKDPYINNTRTDFSKFKIPAKGSSVKLTKDNIAWYRRVITAYEGHKLEEKQDGIYIDGKKTDTYTFKMNYYWMMGDNRYNSADSRVWGFVPEDHIVGKASMVWFSKDAYVGVRWERLFTLIK